MKQVNLVQFCAVVLAKKSCPWTEGEQNRSFTTALIGNAMARHTSLISILLTLLISSQVVAGISVESKYSYKQEGVLSLEGSEEIVGSLDRKVTLPNAIYEFDIVSDSEDVYELKSKAELKVNIDGRALNGFSGDGWFRTRAQAFSSSQLVDTAIVEGIDGQFGGLVEFLWDVTGISTISLDPKLRSDGYRINELYTTAFFNTLEEGAIPELLLNDQSQPPLGTRSIDSAQPNFFEPVVTFVDWLVGEELDVFFELQTNAALSVENLDAAGFEAVVSSDFSNTAVLREIRIRDEDGNIIPDAYLVGEGGFIYDPAGLGLGGGGRASGPSGGGGSPGNPGSGGGSTSVPEPATIVIWLALIGLVGVRVRRPR